MKIAYLLILVFTSGGPVVGRVHGHFIEREPCDAIAAQMNATPPNPYGRIAFCVEWKYPQ